MKCQDFFGILRQKHGADSEWTLGLATSPANSRRTPLILAGVTASLGTNFQKGANTGTKARNPTTTNNTLELLRQRGNACKVPPELQISSVSTAAAHLQSSEPLADIMRGGRLQSSRSLSRQRSQRISRDPIPLCLLLLLHVPTRAAHLQSSQSPYLDVLRLQRTTRAPEPQRQTPTRPNTRSTPPELQIS